MKSSLSINKFLIDVRRPSEFISVFMWFIILSNVLRVPKDMLLVHITLDGYY